MEKLYTLRDACEILQIDPTTLRKWDREGKIRCIRLQNNYRRVPESEINRILGIMKERTSYIYARVSSSGQKEDLERQKQNLTTVSPQSVVISDVRSGMKFNRKGFLELLDLIEDDKVSTIYITHKDRLARFGFDLIERICEIHGTKIVETDGEEILSANEELSRDLISIITSFSARLYGLRSHKTGNCWMR
ncbi:DNA binding domain protein, excisionase family [mine drainage metagenome]|uniref:DNA binding domain protein, excisionase family n=1 Tax=mine drainage metagenome TaxID=410659 RepID=T1CB47_9ZZZZ